MDADARSEALRKRVQELRDRQEQLKRQAEADAAVAAHQVLAVDEGAPTNGPPSHPTTGVSSQGSPKNIIVSPSSRRRTEVSSTAVSETPTPTQRRKPGPIASAMAELSPAATPPLTTTNTNIITSPSTHYQHHQDVSAALEYEEEPQHHHQHQEAPRPPSINGGRSSEDNRQHVSSLPRDENELQQQHQQHDQYSSIITSTTSHNVGVVPDSSRGGSAVSAIAEQQDSYFGGASRIADDAESSPSPLKGDNANNSNINNTTMVSPLQQQRPPQTTTTSVHSDNSYSTPPARGPSSSTADHNEVSSENKNGSHLPNPSSPNHYHDDHQHQHTYRQSQSQDAVPRSAAQSHTKYESCTPEPEPTVAAPRPQPSVSEVSTSPLVRPPVMSPIPANTPYQHHPPHDHPGVEAPPKIQQPQHQHAEPTEGATNNTNTNTSTVLSMYNDLLSEEARLKGELAKVQSHLQVYSQVLRSEGYAIPPTPTPSSSSPLQQQGATRSAGSGDTVRVLNQSPSRQNSLSTAASLSVANRRSVRDSVFVNYSNAPIAPQHPSTTTNYQNQGNNNTIANLYDSLRPTTTTTSTMGSNIVATSLNQTPTTATSPKATDGLIGAYPSPYVGMMSPPVDRSSIGQKQHIRRGGDRDMDAAPQTGGTARSRPTSATAGTAKGRAATGRPLSRNGGGASSAYSTRPLARNPPTAAPATSIGSKRPEFSNFCINSESPEDRRKLLASDHLGGGGRSVMFGDVPRRPGADARHQQHAHHHEAILSPTQQQHPPRSYHPSTPGDDGGGLWLNATSPSSTGGGGGEHSSLSRDHLPSSSRQLVYNSVANSRHQDVHAELATLRAAREEREANRRMRDAYSPKWYK